MIVRFTYNNQEHQGKVDPLIFNNVVVVDMDAYQPISAKFIYFRVCARHTQLIEGGHERF